ILAAIFAVAGIAKLRDRSSTRRALIGFGAPIFGARTLAVVLPIAEVMVSVALLPTITARTGALGALLLLSIFTVAVATSLARGRAPQCQCFGQLHSAPASWKTICRNVALCGLALLSYRGVGTASLNAKTSIARFTGAELLAAITGMAAVGTIG